MLGITSGIASVVTAVGPSIARRDEMALAFHRCLERAIRGAANAQVLSADVSTVLLTHLTPTIAAQALFADIERIAASDRAEVWGDELERIFGEDTSIESAQVNVRQLALETASQLVHEIRNEAISRNSPLLPAFMLSKLSEQGPSRAPNAGSGASVTNFADLAWGAEPVMRPEQSAVEERLAEGAVAILAGGPGMGKSTIARMAIQQRLGSDDVALIWWMTASTPEKLVESCESLLAALDIKPSADPCRQVREVLFERSDWFLIIDDAPDADAVGRVIPVGVSPGHVLVTTRSAVTFDARSLVRMESADAHTLRAIARANLQAEVSDDDLDGLITVCGGNPLVLVTACRYATATGRSVLALPGLLASAPARVLDTPVGAAYPDTFVDVMRKAQTQATAQNALAWHLMLALAIAGGDAVPRAVIEAALLVEADSVELDDGLSVLNSLGLIEFGESTVRCHGLVAVLVVELAEDPLRQRSAAGILAAVQAVAVLADDSRTIIGLGTVLDSAQEHVSPNDPSRILSRLQLVERLGALGLVQTAARHLSVAESHSAKLPREEQVQIVLARARLHLAMGEPREARDVLHDILREAGLSPSLRAAACTTLAWAEQGIGDHSAAVTAAATAAQLAPGDHHLQALAEHFAMTNLPPNEKVRRYLALDEEARRQGYRPGGPGGLYLGLASRACIEARRLEEAVTYAESALRLDQEIDGARSQNVARDLNDLGMALLADRRFDSAEEVLREAISIYETEFPGHPMSAVPMLHLGRILVEHGHRSTREKEEILSEARSVLQAAIGIQEKKAPMAAEMAALLYALGDTELVRDLAAASRAYEDARVIDTAVYGPTHREVGLDVSRLMQVHVALRQPARALSLLSGLKPSIQDWELSDPELAFALLSWQLVASLEQPHLSALQRAELGSVAHRVRGLLHVSDERSEHRALIMRALEHLDRLDR